MDSSFFEQLGGLEILLIIVVLSISILMIIAILKLPQINKYLRALVKLNALRAKQEGVSREQINTTINEADPSILFNTEFEKTMNE